MREGTVVNIGRRPYATLDHAVDAIREKVCHALAADVPARELLTTLNEALHQIRYYQKARGTGCLVMGVFRAYANHPRWAPINAFTWSAEAPLPTFAALLLTRVVFGGQPDENLPRRLRERCRRRDLTNYIGGGGASARARLEERRSAQGHIRPHFPRASLYVRRRGETPGTGGRRDVEVGWVFGRHGLAQGLWDVLRHSGPMVS